jgi:hypothetical protein
MQEYTSKFTIEDLNKLIDKLNKTKSNTEFNLYFTADGFSYYNAMTAGDHKKMEELNAKFRKQRIEEISKLNNYISPEVFELVSMVDNKLSRHGFTRSASLYGEKYIYWWNIPKNDALLKFKDSKFSLIRWDEDDVYCQDDIVVKEDMSKEELMELIN